MKQQSKEKPLGGEYINWIKVDEINQCIILASYEFKKVCLFDLEGNKLIT